MIKRAFTEHPASVGESYFQHMGMAFGFGTGRKCIEELHHQMVAHRDKRNCPDSAPASALPAMTSESDILRAAE